MDIRAPAHTLVHERVEMHPSSTERHDGWAASNGDIAHRIIIYDLFHRGVISNSHDYVNGHELPNTEQVGAIINSLATCGNGPFLATDHEAARILTPLQWSKDWDCYEYRNYAFALSGFMAGLHNPMDMPPCDFGIMVLGYQITTIEEERGSTVQPPFQLLEEDLRTNDHGSRLVRIAAYDGSTYGRTTENTGRLPFAGQLGHARPQDVRTRAEQIVEMRRDRWDRRDEIDAKVAPVRAKVERELGDREHVKLLSVSLDRTSSFYGEQFLIRLGMKDDKLVEHVAEVELSAHRGNKLPNIGPLRKLLAKADEREKRVANGLLIDSVLAMTLDDMGKGFIRAFAQHLDRGGKPSHFPIMGYVGYVPGAVTAFALKNACVMAKVKLGEGAFWNDGRITVRATTLPQVVISTLVGRRLGTVIEHRYLDPEAQILEARMHPSGSLIIRVEPKRVTLADAAAA